MRHDFATFTGMSVTEAVRRSTEGVFLDSLMFADVRADEVPDEIVEAGGGHINLCRAAGVHDGVDVEHSTQFRVHNPKAAPGRLMSDWEFHGMEPHGLISSLSQTPGSFACRNTHAATSTLGMEITVAPLPAMA